MRNDAELLRCYARDRSDEAFAELVRRHVGFVYAAALRQLNGATHRAEDVTQTVFIDLARKAAALSRREHLLGWLHTSTRFACAKLKRAEQRRQHREQEAHAMHEILADDSSTVAAWEQLRPVLDDAMGELSEGEREVILLRFFQGRRFAGVGEALGLTEDAARMRVERALGRLRLALERRHVTSTTAALALALGNLPAVAVPATLAASVTGAALAGASGGLAGGVTLILMKTKLTLAAGGAALVVGFAVHQSNEARRARQEAHALTGEREALRVQVGELERRVASAEQRSAELQRQAAAGPALRNATAFTAPSAAPATTAGGTFSFRAATPEQARARNGENVDATYAALYRRLNWTPEQREQFRNVMLDRQESGERLFKAAIAAARQKNPALDRAGMHEVFEATQAQIQLEQQEEAKRVFGTAVGEALAHYQSILPARSIATQLANSLYHSPTPLTPAQSDQVAEILAQHARGPLGKVEVGLMDADTAMAQLESAGVLTSVQTAELRRIVARVTEQAVVDKARNTGSLVPEKARVPGSDE
jgi:RNA polymerase sigma factor (sigma-70 family)